MTEVPGHDFSQDPEMESRLRSARPKPDDAFVEKLESRLFVPGRARRRSWRPAFAAAFAVAAIALLTLAFDLAGIGPFSDNPSVEAGSKCHTVVVAKRERQPVTTPGSDVVTFKYKTVKRHVQRCD